MAEARDHRNTHIEFCQTFSDENITKWMAMVDKWNEEPKDAPDPYEEPLGMNYKTTTATLLIDNA